MEMLLGPSKDFIGFTMRKVRNQKEIHSLASPASRKTAFPKASFPFLVRTALNISRAVASVHATGCVIGDVNQKGFLVGDDATATLIDCDSFQANINGKLFLCKVAVSDYLPPELNGKRLDQTLRTATHD